MTARRVRVGEVAGVLAVLLAAAYAPLPRGTAAAVPRSVVSVVMADIFFLGVQEPFARLSNYRYGGIEPEGFVRPAKLPPGLDSPVGTPAGEGLLRPENEFGFQGSVEPAVLSV
ncbi:hypothetical protein Bbelb_144050 [Branchiostoma belcheri]|nr:hypothetical protein Bbelb_144050 [Branchiostoma belcheri]